ncbi:hypothetical protein [Methylobacterium nigriterrae]
MAPAHQLTVRNRLLKAMAPDDFARLQPHLEPADLPIQQMMIEANMILL